MAGMAFFMSENTAKTRRLFTGRFPVGVDGQRRVTFPKLWRLKSDTDDTQFYLVPGRDHRIQVVTEERMGAIFDALEENSSLADRQVADSFTDIASRIQVVSLDKQGRFALNSELAQFAGISDKAVFLGSLNYGTLVSPDGAGDNGSPSESSFDRLQQLEEAVKRARARKPAEE